MEPLMVLLKARRDEWFLLFRSLGTRANSCVDDTTCYRLVVALSRDVDLSFVGLILICKYHEVTICKDAAILWERESHMKLAVCL